MEGFDPDDDAPVAPSRRELQQRIASLESQLHRRNQTVPDQLRSLYAELESLQRQLIAVRIALQQSDAMLQKILLDSK